MRMIPWKKKEAAGRSDLETGLSRLRTEMDRLFDRFFSNPWGLLSQGPWAAWSGWMPALDVADGEKEVTVRVELPGVDPKDIDLSVSGNTLTISGQKKECREEKGKGFMRSECRYGSFQRTVELPAGTDPDKISAEYSRGVLTVRVGKSKPSTVRKISITSR